MNNTKLTENFKHELVCFLENTMHSCSLFIDEVKACDTYEDLKKCFNSNADEIADNLGHTCEECECDDNDDSWTISNMKEKIEELEQENNDLLKQYIPALTYWDEEKIEIFKQYYDKYTPVELENLMINGIRK